MLSVKYFKKDEKVLLWFNSGPIAYMQELLMRAFYIEKVKSRNSDSSEEMSVERKVAILKEKADNLYQGTLGHCKKSNKRLKTFLFFLLVDCLAIAGSSMSGILYVKKGEIKFLVFLIIFCILFVCSVSFLICKYYFAYSKEAANVVLPNLIANCLVRIEVEEILEEKLRVKRDSKFGCTMQSGGILYFNDTLNNDILNEELPDLLSKDFDDEANESTGLFSNAVNHDNGESNEESNFDDDISKAWKKIFGDATSEFYNKNWCFPGRYHAWFASDDFTPLVDNPGSILCEAEWRHLRMLQERFISFIYPQSRVADGGNKENVVDVSWLNKRYKYFLDEVRRVNKQLKPSAIEPKVCFFASAEDEQEVRLMI